MYGMAKKSGKGRGQAAKPMPPMGKKPSRGQAAKPQARPMKRGK